MHKVVIFGGGFSSGFSHYVEMIDVETGQWKSLPKMKEGRDLRNKVVHVDGAAYAIGGLNKKCEKLYVSKRKWSPIEDYIINDNLDSWSCSLMFTPHEDFSDKDFEETDRVSDSPSGPDEEDDEGEDYYEGKNDFKDSEKYDSCEEDDKP